MVFNLGGWNYPIFKFSKICYYHKINTKILGKFYPSEAPFDQNNDMIWEIKSRDD